MSLKDTLIVRLAAAVVAGCLVIASISSCSNPPAGVKGSGTVEAREITLAARSQGELVSVETQEGSKVTEGAVLARIDAEDLELQLEQSIQRLEGLRAQLDLLLSGAQSEDIRQVEAQLQLAQEAFELARKSYNRTQNLYSGGSATSSDLDKAETEFRQAQARVDSAQARVDKLKSLPRPEEVRATRAQVAEAETAVKRMRRRLEDTQVIAPRAGTITTLAREEGEYVTPGTPIATIADLSSVYLTIYIPEPQLGQISLGQSAQVFVDGMPERSFNGKITKIAEEAEFTPKNVQTQEARAQLVFAVEITINNTEGIFKIGMPADAIIETEQS